MTTRCWPRSPRGAPLPELPEMEIVARRLDAALPGETIESALTPGINALKTFDPPFSALAGAEFTGAREALAARREHGFARAADAAPAPDERRPAAAVRQAGVAAGQDRARAAA